MSKVSRCALALLGPFTLIVGFAVINHSIPVSATAQKQGKEKGKESKKEKKSKGESAAPTQAGVPALWEDRGDVSKLNLILGIGSEAGKPKAPFQFDKEDTTGTNPKIKIIDANGVKWNLKFDEEVHAEIAQPHSLGLRVYGRRELFHPVRQSERRNRVEPRQKIRRQ